MNFIDREKIITYGLIFIGILSLVFNLVINYDLSFSNYNRKVYEIRDRLSNYPKPILLFAKKRIKQLNTNEVYEMEAWLDNKNNSKTKIKIRDNKIYLTVQAKNEFILSNFINKLYLLPNIEIINLNFSKISNEINIVLGENYSL